MHINKCDDNNHNTTPENEFTTDESISVKNNRGKKRKRNGTQGDSDVEETPQGNSVEAQKCSNNSVLKNSSEDMGLKKVTKKVATNDHVLALVKLKEKEDSLKLTRSKVKELMKASPNSASWDLELTPIKRIPVKTRPEVEALIAQELPEDDDDEEYKPTQEDVPSDDDQTLESCSDVESQPRTPVTQQHLPNNSPQVVKDGPFKVPQDMKSVARRRLELEEEEATIALRTRSKLSLSSTSIEHIESSFVPPDDLPVPDVDDLWNQFLEECLNPAPPVRHEDDDEADPEYNVAADPDAHDEDEEVLESEIIKISKKELNDLVTELFSIMPEATNNDELADCLAKNVELENQMSCQAESTGILPATHWEGKQEPLANEERQQTNTIIERRDSRISVGKCECDAVVENYKDVDTIDEPEKSTNNKKNNQRPSTIKTRSMVKVSVEETEMSVSQDLDETAARVPPVLCRTYIKQTNTLEIEMDESLKVLPEQIAILQQQLRQHVQLATSNFLQLYIHPTHWKIAPNFKEYLQSLHKLGKSNPKSVVNVCNLAPACELIATWEESVSENTPENKAMVEFITKELERSRRRMAQNSTYVGEFHETFKKVVANSTVFLYPYLLPPMPYRPDISRRYSYLRPEDELIALGLDEFWQYVESNPKIFKPPSKLHPRHRWGLSATCQLVTKFLFPWIPPCALLGHIRHVRKLRDNPIAKLFAKREVTPVKHKLLPFNPKLTLYEHPEHEIPRLWVRYLAKSSKRFRDHLYRRTAITGMPPTAGVVVDLGQSIDIPTKSPLHIDFIKSIRRAPSEPEIEDQPMPSNQIQINTLPRTDCLVPTNFFSMVQTSTGTVLVPLMMQTNTVTSNIAPISSTTEAPPTNEVCVDEKPKECDPSDKDKVIVESDHCQCCVLLRQICKQRQTVITEYFKKNNRVNKTCPCKQVQHPKISNKLRLLVDNYKSFMRRKCLEVQAKLESMKNEQSCDERLNNVCSDSNQDDLDFVTQFLIKLNMRVNIARNSYTKKRLYSLLSKFDPSADSPVRLANDLYRSFGVDMVDMYKEFMAFLTPEQAEEVDKFKDHFVMTCVSKIMKKIEESVSEHSKRLSMLSQLNTILANNMLSACEICSGLLNTMHGYPKLATFVFNLFPHIHRRKSDDISEDSTSHETEREEATDSLKNDSRKSPIDYEADDSSSDEEDSESENIKEKESSPIDTKTDIIMKEEETKSNYVLDTPELTVSKTEVQEPLNSSHSPSDISMLIVTEDDQIKAELPEWTREEDKLILEALKQFITPEERKNGTILELIQEKQVPQIISENLPYKSMRDIIERILLLLEILAQSEH